jgi:peroxiredoxin Q/BCP
VNKKMIGAFCLAFGILIGLGSLARAAELKTGDAAPEFKAKTDSGADFDLASRKGQWTVLYFYPKAETPGCTKQACAYRDNIKKVQAQGAEIYGISADDVTSQAKFKKNHQLNFTLLADPDETVIKAYGTKMMMLPMSKRWTFIIGPDLKIRSVQKDVDPAVDALKTAELIGQLKTAQLR